MYNLTRYLWKNIELFQEEYHVLRTVGFSRPYIIMQLIKYICKSAKYKLNV